jgi:hypothetical protein
VAVALVLGGMAWILSLSTLSSLYQLSLPQWVKARGMSFYLVVFQGGNALGSAVLAILAERIGLSPTLVLATAGLALGPLAGLRYRFRPLRPDELVPAGEWPEPQLTGDGAPPGPVLVTFEYHAAAGREAELLAALEDARFSRRRTGASSWRLWRDSTEQDRILEQFVVASWDEHVRQRERVTKRDHERYQAIRALTDPARPPTVTHWLTPLSRNARQAATRQAGADGRSPNPGPSSNPP